MRRKRHHPPTTGRSKALEPSRRQSRGYHFCGPSRFFYYWGAVTEHTFFGGPFVREMTHHPPLRMLLTLLAVDSTLITGGQSIVATQDCNRLIAPQSAFSTAGRPRHQIEWRAFLASFVVAISLVANRLGPPIHDQPAEKGALFALKAPVPSRAGASFWTP